MPADPGWPAVAPPTLCWISQFAKYIGEGGLKSVVVFPAKEGGDVIFAEFDGQVFADVGVEAASVVDAVAAH